MDLVTQMRVFVRVAEAQGFTAAARQLGVSKSVVSKYIGELEDRLGVRLFHRTTRSLSLTEHGAGYYERCTHILAEIEEAEATIGASDEEPRGTVRVLLPTAFALERIVPALPTLLKKWPRLGVDLVLDDYADLASETASDVAVRLIDNEDIASDDVRVFRLTRIRGKVGYSSKAEHDFPPPENFDPRVYATRTDWQLGDPVGRARVWVSSKIDWLVERHFGQAGTIEPAPDGDGVILETEYADPRAIVSWVLGLRDRARIVDPPELVEEAAARVARIVELHSAGPELAPPAKRRARAPAEPEANGKRETPIRPERFARLVTLAGILIEAARSGDLLNVAQVCDSLQVSEEELREDIDVLNVVNFGGGSYVLYAEVHGDSIEVDPEPYGDNFAKPARLLPLEAKALVAAIDLLGDHLPEGSLASARAKIVTALGQDPAREGLQITTASGDDSEIAGVVSTAIADHRVLEIDYYKANEDELTAGRRIEPSHLLNGQEGWYVHSWDPAKEESRSFRLDRIKEARLTDERFEPRADVSLDVPEWARTGQVPASQVARVWIAPERARWAREENRVVEELSDGAAIYEQSYAGSDWLVRAILGEAGDAVVLEPEAARAAVREAAEALMGMVSR